MISVKRLEQLTALVPCQWLRSGMQRLFAQNGTMDTIWFSNEACFGLPSL
jgi:hypothetical protein